MLILAIESSCDETACAVVEDGIKEIASELATSADLHHKTGGIVPEVAARKQVEFIVPIIESTINKTADYFKIPPDRVKDKIDAVAATVGPGLVGSLIVGVEAAKALALAWNKPLIPVNHLVGHIYGNFVGDKVMGVFPAVVLIVSGGHTDLVLMKNHGDLEYLGGTIDDAAGEAFDKAARLLNLAMYLGGANLSKTAHDYSGPTLLEKLPRSFMHEDNFDFSFSGLKTAVKRMVDKNIYPVPAIAKEFEEAVVEVLVEKTLKAVKHTGARSIMLGGGVSANQKLREELANRVKMLAGVSQPSRSGSRISPPTPANVCDAPHPLRLFIPPLKLCTDNAVCIASTAFFNQTVKPFDQIVPNPSLTIKDY